MGLACGYGLNDLDGLSQRGRKQRGLMDVDTGSLAMGTAPSASSGGANSERQPSGLW